MRSQATTSPFHICIVGGGIVGLTGSILFRLQGFRVTVLEKDEKLRDVGAGIQLQPNAVRILEAIGVYEKIKPKSVVPALMIIKTYKTGQVLHAQQLHDSTEKYGAPLITLHRAHLCAALYERAVSLGVTIRHGIKIETGNIDMEIGIIKIINSVNSSEIIRADLFVGADGVQSVVRDVLTGRKAKALPHGKIVQRILIPEHKIIALPGLSKLIEDPNIIIWLGPECEAVTYGLDGMFNVSFTWPWSSDTDSIFFGPQPVEIGDFLGKLGNWDSQLREILSLATDCVRFMLFEPEVDGPTTPWIDPSGKFCIVGDAAHRSLPYIGKGAAMGIESVAILSHLLAQSIGEDRINRSLQIYQLLRKDRTAHVCRATLKTGMIWQMPDGPLQNERDRQFLCETPTIGYPNPLEDPFFQEWLWGFDVATAVREAWRREDVHRQPDS
ncbi:FAD binding domain-containing protein [Xylariaceae sp. FL1272]|nr:FAD binding domain-containing protein [Xylariaceae sp. FL1272]